MTSLDEIRETFFIECDEQLEALADGLTELEAGDAVSETVNTMFRAVHSIKGGAASFNLDALTQFAHTFEYVLDDLRSERLAVTPDLLRQLYKATDHLAALVADGGMGSSFGDDQLQAMIDEIGALAHGGMPQDVPQEDLSFAPVLLDFLQGAEKVFTLSFQPTRQLYALGHDPVHLFRELDGLGTMTVTLTEPDTEGDGLLGWQIVLEASCEAHEILEIFEFVEDLATIDLREGDVQEDDDVPPPEPEPGIAPKAPGGEPAAPQAAAKAQTSKATLRVDLELVDGLINLVGELVINQSVLTQAFHEATDESTRIDQSLEELKTLTRQIQESVMSLRAQSVKPLFQRMARIARETADISGKDVYLQLHGETTEVDRTVIEHLVDPLTHILRNAIDHGLEPTAVRVANGKEATGQLTLSAQHRSGRVLIEVSDDGGGINREKVLAKAIEKGLVPEGAALSPQEIDRLLFLPGFSTADEVTKLSGRGVGMDVVNKEIQKLGGRIAISSEAGRGTTLTISLPLTLAVLDGMVVDVAGQTMVVPISAIIETIRPKAGQVHRIGVNSRMVCVRDVLIPIIDLAATFEYQRPDHYDENAQILLLIETAEDERRALAVDRIYDQRQVVIKSLESNYGQVAGISAATILGDGKIALIIDPDEVANRGSALSQTFNFKAIA